MAGLPRPAPEAVQREPARNRHDNAVAKTFFKLFKRERVRRQIYAAREDARFDVFNYIEMFYNRKRPAKSP